MWVSEVNWTNIGSIWTSEAIPDQSIILQVGMCRNCFTGEYRYRLVIGCRFRYFAKGRLTAAGGNTSGVFVYLYLCLTNTSVWALIHQNCHRLPDVEIPVPYRYWPVFVNNKYWYQRKKSYRHTPTYKYKQYKSSTLVDFCVSQLPMLATLAIFSFQFSLLQSSHLAWYK